MVVRVRRLRLPVPVNASVTAWATAGAGSANAGANAGALRTRRLRLTGRCTYITERVRLTGRLRATVCRRRLPHPVSFQPSPEMRSATRLTNAVPPWRTKVPANIREWKPNDVILRFFCS